jgi:hypothetical protein
MLAGRTYERIVGRVYQQDPDFPPDLSICRRTVNDPPWTVLLIEMPMSRRLDADPRRPG